jgi:CheY-like chemotaxis protein
MKKAKILVVEDQNIVALNIRNKLMNLGYTVPATAATGEEAIRKAELTSADLVLMDIMLKGDMDGISAAQKIKSQLGIPILYLTAYTDEEPLSRAKMTEPTGYISKPFKEGDLHSNIEMALHKNRLERGKMQNKISCSTSQS